jgi:hypothetical protein
MSYIPEMVMPEKEPNGTRSVDEIEVREYDDYSQDEQDDIGVEEDIEPLPPPPQKKEKLKKEDIFKPKQPPPKKVNMNQDPVISEQEPIVPKIAPVKKKRELSDAQKEALARGRAKRAENKKQATAPAAGSYAEPVYEPPAEAVAYKQKKMNEDYNRQHPINNGLSQDQLQEAIFRGVAIYDNMRKERKAEKHKQQMAQAHNQKVFTDLNSQMRSNDIWSSAFNF